VQKRTSKGQQQFSRARFISLGSFSGEDFLPNAQSVGKYITIERRMKMFRTYKRSLLSNTSRLLERGAEVLASIDAEKSMAAKMEEAIAKIVNSDEETQIVLRRIAIKKLGTDIPMTIMPRINDQTLLIEGYCLVVPNINNILQVVIEKENMLELDNYLTELAITSDTQKIEAFLRAVRDAINRV